MANGSRQNPEGLPRRSFLFAGKASSVTTVVPQPVSGATPPLPSEIPVTTRWLSRWLISRSNLHGAYSIERLFAFQAYSCHVPLVRILVACILTPLLPVVAILLLECIPLASPSLGWKANYLVFIRIYVGAAANAQCIIFQARNIIPDLCMTRREAATIVLATATAYTATFLALSAAWIFPVPFMVVVGAFPFALFASLALVVTVGIGRIRTVPSIGQRLGAFLRLTAIQSSMIIIYPVFQAIFLRQRSPLNQIIAVFVLQFLKLILKALLAYQITGGIDDYKPEIVVLSVDVFHGFYVASCVQTTNSTWTKVVIIGLDVAHQVTSLNGIRKRVRELRKHLVEIQWINRTRFDVVSLAVALAQKLENLEVTRLQHIQVQSILDHGAQTLRTANSLIAVKPPTQRPQAKSTSIIPFPLSPSLAKPTHKDSIEQPPAQCTDLDQAQVLQQTLSLLFSCEYLALAEYVECVLPFVYAVYLSVMHSLSNAQYYPQIANMDTHRLQLAFSTIMVYSALELVTFVVFHLVVRRHFGISPFHQLGFVLENQIEMVEGKLLAWVLIVLQFPLVHMGADFSFAFSWIH